MDIKFCIKIESESRNRIKRKNHNRHITSYMCFAVVSLGLFGYADLFLLLSGADISNLLLSLTTG